VGIARTVESIALSVDGKDDMSLSDYYIAQWEKAFGVDENHSCEWFSYCSGCHESGWKDLFNYDQADGNYYCDYCLEKERTQDERNVF